MIPRTAERGERAFRAMAKAPGFDVDAYVAAYVSDETERQRLHLLALELAEEWEAA
jgi:hypothetical protein